MSGICKNEDCNYFYIDDNFSYVRRRIRVHIDGKIPISGRIYVLPYFASRVKPKNELFATIVVLKRNSYTFVTYRIRYGIIRINTRRIRR